ncbi:hypothetical protein [Enterovibrio norvegicus]|uniref:hypothetical protein n=1 Tax=Enterovibrio norvegicus TaxID=188144 RepID=UPI000C827832|nr:hypothetical protein [Enterovibrio norvegicus]PMH64252.1 hypothetical protein BCU62_16355 [Enterovibrio norvegicus]
MKVSNPLTIIAIFAGVAESFATGALVLLPEQMQEKFIYFVMFFPVLIVVCFFLILALKPQVLYAPSDFSNEEHYLSANNLKEVVAAQTAKVLNEEKQKDGLSSDIKALSNKVAERTVQILEEEMDKKVLDYMLARPREAFTNRGLGHTLVMSKQQVLESLARLENAGKVVSGMDENTRVWQTKT